MSIVAQLLFLNHEDPDKEIQMYINSPGGQVYAGLAIYDTMKMISNPISTVAVGVTASFGDRAADGRNEGPALRAAARHHSHAPAAGRCAGPGHGHRDRGQADPAQQGRR